MSAGGLPRKDLWLAAIADDIAVASRNVFHDLRIVRHTFAVVSVATGLRLNPQKSVVVNFARRSHAVVQHVASEESVLPVRGVGRYLGLFSATTPLRIEGLRRAPSSSHGLGM